jgi:hypothetical protein
VLLISFIWSATPNIADNCGMQIQIGGTNAAQTYGHMFFGSLIQNPICITLLHTVTSGEISGGNVAIKPQYRATSHTLTVRNGGAGTSIPYLSVLNLGH